MEPGRGPADANVTPLRGVLPLPVDGLHERAKRLRQLSLLARFALLALHAGAHPVAGEERPAGRVAATGTTKTWQLLDQLVGGIILSRMRPTRRTVRLFFWPLAIAAAQVTASFAG